MTKIQFLLRSCSSGLKKNILLDTQYSNIIWPNIPNCNVSIFDRLNIFSNFDTIIIDQSNIARVEDLYKRFLSNIIILDNVSYSVGTDDESYWKQIKTMHEYYNNTYKAIFIALNKEDYIKSNYSHNYLINIHDANEWGAII